MGIDTIFYAATKTTPYTTPKKEHVEAMQDAMRITAAIGTLGPAASTAIHVIEAVSHMADDKPHKVKRVAETTFVGVAASFVHKMLGGSH